MLLKKAQRLFQALLKWFELPKKKSIFCKWKLGVALITGQNKKILWQCTCYVINMLLVMKNACCYTCKLCIPEQT